MRFETKHLQIAPLSERDREAAVELLTDETVGRTYMVPEFRCRAEADRLFDRLADLSTREDRYVAGIYLDGMFIGILNETEVSGGSIELGCAILPRFHNCGYGTEALTGAIADLFHRGFDEIVAGAFEDNGASIRVMVKSGMRKLDRQDEISYRGRTHRCVYYSARKKVGL